MDKLPNNKFPGNPGIMCDGRAFTDYRPNVDINNGLSSKFLGHHHNDHLYRQYLTKNGQNIMDDNYERTFQKVKCRNCHSRAYVGNMIPGKPESFLEFAARPKNLM